MEIRVNGGVGTAVAEIGGIALAEKDGIFVAKIDAIIKLAGLPRPVEE
jgi:hypothetical protein